MRETSAHACLMNALAVSEFLATFGVLCEASKLSLQELQQAASSLSSKSALAQLYSSLLRCVLLEKVWSIPAASHPSRWPLTTGLSQSLKSILQKWLHGLLMQ